MYMKTRFVILALIIMIAEVAVAQVASRRVSVHGIVKDKDEPLIGVTIQVQGENKGTISDVDGQFALEDLIPGSVLEFSYIGYAKCTYKVERGSDNLEIVMEKSSTVLDDVVVTGQAVGQKMAIMSQINSVTLKNVISAEKLQQNPDANLVEAIGRLPGITVNREAGEGTGFLLRGLDQSYSKVLINGEAMPVGLNSVSTYALQDVEVYKSLTADMEGDAVAGTVDLSLRMIPGGLHFNVTALSGYNVLNSDFKNYSLLGQISDRFADDKLGLSLTLSADRNNRSTSLLSSGYNTNWTTDLNAPFYLNSMSFNVNERVNYKESAVLSMDYKPSASTILNLNSFLSLSSSKIESQSKSFAPEGAQATVPINVVLSKYPDYDNFGMTHSLTGKTTLPWLNAILTYGLTYSYNKSSTTQVTSNYTSTTRADGLLRDELMVMQPDDVASHFASSLSGLEGTRQENMVYDNTEATNWNLSPRIDLEVPFDFFDGWLHGNVKVGGKYRYAETYSDRTGGTAACSGNAIFDDYFKEKYGWGADGSFPVGLVVDGRKDNFMGGNYDFGDMYSMDRMMLVFNDWYRHGYDTFMSGESSGVAGDPQYYGFFHNMYNSAVSDLSVESTYWAGYIMPEFNIGKYVMFIPGVRYEFMRHDMRAYRGTEVFKKYSIHQDVAEAFGLERARAERNDRKWLPMIHLRVKPVDWAYMHFSYTHTVRRPGLEQISPYEYINTQLSSSYAYSCGVPDLKSELWKSYDLQLTFHHPKFGLLSITGFNKTVQDKLWTRSYKRVKGDPIPAPVFRDNDLVNMTVHENHPYDITLRGVEVELQTSFSYLPKPLSYLTLGVNYTYTYGKQPNPYTEIYQYRPEGERYQVTARRDSVVPEPMTGIPKHVVNATLGVEVKQFKAYLSYQYSSEKIQSTHPNDLRLYIIREPYQRLDFNASYGFTLKNSSMIEILFKGANLTNSEDRVRYRGDSRPLSVEKYGVSLEIGARYKF